ncbi:hypothetical protein HNQ07_002087 [Deinococcus metalli]|uniref:Biotin-protein ligase N-terminal domain-containing protein n=1 Tax=Deinococcus metalli TaxID=1141878 RepID=A0A7W8NR86_9DEIO|nr:BPL-N domain-containing protein [Deinococcus metalli]MBB5376623.1 hypothetical protein [Deinococcus metalli]GHF42705.1 hypothetical protein GCM10017781_18790 [Deinococcus metalli]
MSAAPAWWTALRAELAPLLPGLRVAVYASGGAPYHHAALVAQWGGVPEPLSAERIQAGALAGYDVLVMPGGGLLGMGGLLAALGVEGSTQIREWVAGGGMYVGSCAGAYLPARVPTSFAEQHPAILPLHLLDVPLANGADGGLGGLDSPGVGVLHAAVSAPTHWLTRGLPPHFEVVHYNGPCFTPTVGSDVAAVTRVEAAGEAFTPWERSLPGDAPALVDTLIESRAANVVAGPFGDGTVVLFGSHPEFGFDALQLGWGEAARLFGNALLYQSGRRRRAEPSVSVSAMTTDLTDVADALSTASQRFQRLTTLAPDLSGAPAFLGSTPTALWTAALSEAATLSADTAEYVMALTTVPTAYGPWLDSPAAPGQDYGFVGLRQLAAQILSLLDQAEEHLRSPPPPVTSPYGEWDRHPYHLLASSYLSAAGLSASASLAAGTLGTLSGTDRPPPHPMFRPLWTSPERKDHD